MTAKRTKKGAKPDNSIPVFNAAGDINTNPEAARLLHTTAIPGVAYGTALGRQFGQLAEQLNLDQSAITYATDLMQRMAPRDPLEEMLLAQALMAHARALHLSVLANKQTELHSLQTVHGCADKVSYTFPRLMLALADYRRPPHGEDTFNAIRQANIAEQQVVMNGQQQEMETVANEQGCPDRQEDRPGEPTSEKELPTFTGGTGRPAIAAGSNPDGFLLDQRGVGFDLQIGALVDLGAYLFGYANQPKPRTHAMPFDAQSGSFQTALFSGLDRATGPSELGRFVDTGDEEDGEGNVRWRE